jgi:hypothetical protein
MACVASSNRHHCEVMVKCKKWKERDEDKICVENARSRFLILFLLLLVLEV